MKLTITSKVDELFRDVVTWEIQAPFDVNGIPVVIAEWQREELRRRMCELFTDLTGRPCEGEYEDETFAAMIEAENAGEVELPHIDSWAHYQRVQAERAKRDAWAMEE